MGELKTKRNEGDVDSFIASIEDDRRRQDAAAVRDLMAEVTDEAGSRWRDSIVGFGDHEYAAAGGSSSWFEVGFSPRKQSLVLYLMSGLRGPRRPARQARTALDRKGMSLRQAPVGRRRDRSPRLDRRARQSFVRGRLIGPSRCRVPPGHRWDGETHQRVSGAGQTRPPVGTLAVR
jgi:hypothetical protein